MGLSVEKGPRFGMAREVVPPVDCGKPELLGPPSISSSNSDRRAMSTCLIRYTPVRLLELRKFSHVVALKKEPRVAGRATDAAGPVFPIDASAGKIRKARLEPRLLGIVKRGEDF